MHIGELLRDPRPKGAGKLTVDGLPNFLSVTSYEGVSAPFSARINLLAWRKTPTGQRRPAVIIRTPGLGISLVQRFLFGEPDCGQFVLKRPDNFLPLPGTALEVSHYAASVGAGHAPAVAASISLNTRPNTAARAATCTTT
jgi:hypothetical protein